MKQETRSKAVTSVGLLAAIAASLCCITPILAVLAGVSGAASSLSWLTPARPYLIGLAIVALGFAWYKSLSIKQNAICVPDGACVIPTTSFLASKKFLTIITLTAIILMAFPLYAKIFYSTAAATSTTIAIVNNKQQVEFIIKGMSCAACELEVDNEVSKVNGVIGYKTSYASGSSLVTFDTSKAKISAIESAINNTGYTVKNHKLVTVKK